MPALIYAMPKPLTRLLVAVLSTVVVALVAAADYRLGVEVSLIAVYVLPIGIATWYVRPALGYAQAGAAGIILVVLDTVAGSRYSDPVLAYLDSAANALTLAAVAALVGLIRYQLLRERRVNHLDPVTHALNRAGLESALRAEQTRCEYFGRGCSLLLFGIGPDERRASAAMADLAGTLHEGVRRVDSIGIAGRRHLAVLMPETSIQDARAEGTRLFGALSESHTAAKPEQMAVIRFADRPKHAGSALDTALRDLNTTGRRRVELAW